jgi:hypothetical protein
MGMYKLPITEYAFHFSILKLAANEQLMSLILPNVAYILVPRLSTIWAYAMLLFNVIRLRLVGITFRGVHDSFVLKTTHSSVQNTRPLPTSPIFSSCLPIRS